MKTKTPYECRSCYGHLMPLWKNNNWFCTKCKLEQVPTEPIKNSFITGWKK